MKALYFLAVLGLLTALILGADLVAEENTAIGEKEPVHFDCCGGGGPNYVSSGISFEGYDGGGP